MKLSKYYGYMFVLLLFVIIFRQLSFQRFLTVDYIYASFHLKNLIISSFRSHFAYDTLDFMLSKINLSYLFFQISFLVSILVSYSFIKKIYEKDSFFFALIFFFNPFVYSRIMIGQIGILIAYFLTPVYLYYLFNFLKNSSRKNLFKTIITSSIPAAFALQFFIFNILILILSSWFYRFNYKKFTRVIFIFIISIILLNAYLFQGFFSSTVFGKIDVSHEEFFSPKLSQGIPAVAKIIGMWGFWREAGYITAYKTLPLWLWYSITFIFVITMLIGYYSNPNKKSKFFYSLWWVGLIFATGASHPYTAPLFNFLFKYLPFFNGFRDSHKFVVFIVLAYAYLCPAGLYWIRDKLKQFTSNLRFKQLIYYGVPIIFVGIIILYTYPLIGLWGQIKLCEYPESYKETGLFLEFKNITGYIIYLPWEGYLTYNWTIECTPDGRIAVPINKFIQPIAIVSQGKWGYSNSLTNNINTCLINKSITCLEDIGVQYIIKDNCAYYPYAYSWINKTSVHTDRCTQIYQIDNKLKIDRVIKFPLRFIIGFVISFLTFVYLLFIISQKSN